MQKVLLCALLLLWGVYLRAQILTPSELNEYCPKQDYQFTLELIGQYRNFSFTQNEKTTATPIHTAYDQNANKTTFTFLLNFMDETTNHSVQISYQDMSSPAVTSSLNKPFNKIKSLNGRLAPEVNVSSITAQPCTITSTSVSFTAFKWINTSTNTEFGSVTNYEYSVPAGWKVGNTVSTGPNNLITAGNSVVIHSNLGTGGEVKVRAASDCQGFGIAAGQWATIPITRPKPTLTFSGAKTICTSQQFSVSGLPSWANQFQWVVTPSNLASITNPNSATPTINKLGDGAIDVQLTISSSTCGATYTYNTYEIVGELKVQMGAPMTSMQVITYLPYEPSCYEVDAFYVFKAEYNYGDVPTEYEWAYRTVGGPDNIVSSTSDNAPIMFPSAGTYEVVARAKNQCGVGTEVFKTVTVENFCWNMQAADTSAVEYTLYPNPASSEVTVAPNTAKTTRKASPISEVSVRDKDGILVKQQKVYNATSLTLNVHSLKPGYYVVEVVSGSKSVRMPLLIKR